MAVVRGLKRCTHSRKARALGIGEEIAVLLKRRKLDPERSACAHVHKAAATEHRRFYRRLVVVVPVLMKHHPVPGEETRFPGWAIIVISGASQRLADRSQADVFRRIDREQLLTDLPNSVLD